jgi:hypothetical protein
MISSLYSVHPDEYRKIIFGQAKIGLFLASSTTLSVSEDYTASSGEVTGE